MQSVRNAARGQPNRLLALTELARLASDTSNKQAMWDDDSVRAVLLEAAAAQEDADLRTKALEGLMCLAFDQANKEPMWQDDLTRETLLSALKADQPILVQAEAIRTAANLAFRSACAYQLWQPIGDNDAQTSLLAAARNLQDKVVRVEALRTLANLTHHEPLRPQLVGAGVDKLLSQGAALADADFPARLQSRAGVYRNVFDTAARSLSGIQAMQADPAAVKAIQIMDSKPLSEWPGALNGLSSAAAALGADDYKVYLRSTRFNGKRAVRIIDRLDLLQQQKGLDTGSAVRKAIMPDSAAVPAHVIPPGVPTRLLLVIACETSSGQLHSGLILRLDHTNEHFKSVARACSALGESPPVAYYLIHLLPAGSGSTQAEVTFYPSETLEPLEHAVRDVLGAGTVTKVLDITHGTTTTTDWMGPLFNVIEEEEQKNFAINFTQPTQTNCTVFVLSVLRRLGAGGIVNLSQSMVQRLLVQGGIAAPAANDAAQKWAVLWGSFLADPNFAGGAIRQQAAPILQQLAMTASPSKASAGSLQRGVKRPR